MRAVDLVELVGSEAAKKIAEAWGGGGHRERIPTLRLVETAIRNSLILTMWRDGHDFHRIAREARCKVRVVRAVVKQAKAVEKIGR